MIFIKTITAWTRQHPAVLEELNRTGIYRVQPEYIREKNGAIAEYYLELYDWYSRYAAQLVPRPEGTLYPVWLSLDSDTQLPPVGDSVVLALEIPRDKVVITDMDLWGYRVNYMYIPLNQEDLLSHEKELERYGIVNETALILTDKSNFYPLLKRKIIQSWSRMFDPPSRSAAYLQGTVWELRKEWLRGEQKI